MALSGEEIRKRLAPFAAKWSVHEGSERAEAHRFLDDLFDCYGQSRLAVATYEQPQEGKFVDLIWPRVCIFEMKAPGEAGRLSKHRLQALDYWRGAADHAQGIAAPDYVVLCAFRTLEVWQPGKFPGEPRGGRLERAPAGAQPGDLVRGAPVRPLSGWTDHSDVAGTSL